MKLDAGSFEELRKTGRLTTKAGTQPVCVLWDDESSTAYAVDDRCPHMGFPLHRGTIEQGLLTCHWHHARFDLVSGCTLDPFADDVRSYPVDVDGDRVIVQVEGTGESAEHLWQRLDEGLEQGLTLVTAKAVLGLLDAGVPVGDIVAAGVRFGTRYREQGWGSGLTVLVAMGNLIPRLDPGDRALALVHGLAFLSRDTRGRPPRFPLTPLGGGVAVDRLAAWYRRFIDTRTDEAAERTLLTAAAQGAGRAELADLMLAAATDHVFIDGGHTVDFTNKAFECLELAGADGSPGVGDVLATLVRQTAMADRSEEHGSWRHPDDLAALSARACEELLAIADGSGDRGAAGVDDDAVAATAWSLLGESPEEVVGALIDLRRRGGTPEQLGRALALAAALRITRFHTQNDHGDWDVVHHGFTYANAVHQSLVRSPSPLLLRGVVHGALKVYLDRFLNVPAARLPAAPDIAGSLDATELRTGLQECWDAQGQVDRAGGLVHRFVRRGGEPAVAVAALGHALLAEDAEFHWFQVMEAAARQATAWPDGSEEQALILAGAARFLAAHTPTRRELPQVVRIATRLRRGEVLFEEE